MMRYTINYELGKHEGSVTVDNDTMSDSAARQYAATHLFDSGTVEPSDIDVNDISVSYRQVRRP